MSFHSSKTKHKSIFSSSTSSNKHEINNAIKKVIKGENKEERDNKLKKFFLGNINFIGELINISVLSKKIVDQCIETLLKKYQNETEGGVKKYIALEGAVILLDKFLIFGIYKNFCLKKSERASKISITQQ